MRSPLLAGAGAAITIAAVSSMVVRAQQGQAPAPKPPSIVEFGGEKSVTRPSRDATLAFPFPAEVAEIVARGGQPVKKGDLIIRSRDEEDLYQRDLQKLNADSELDIQKAQATLDQAEVEYRGNLDAKAKGGGSKIDIDRAKTTVDLKKVELEIARLQHVQAAVQLKYRQAQLDRNSLKAPFDGRVDEVFVDIGEVKKDSERIARIVSVNPLWIDVPTPTALTITLGLKPGDPAWVVLDLPGDAAVAQGRVIEVGAEADAASDRRRIRVELPNPKEHPSGLTAWVRFEPPKGEWASRLARTPEPPPRQTAQNPAR